MASENPAVRNGTATDPTGLAFARAFDFFAAGVPARELLELPFT
ncbi:MAG: hypothetical protein WBW84_06375 [Acidobacteriaceae bacterium]